mmetsp:Transcript_116805/g.238963  ORF Transcript_116805/g.238963 Transcript_116805/m.238963 type:complete len:81 (+) Transcript_116805:3-245(+)
MPLPYFNGEGEHDDECQCEREYQCEYEYQYESNTLESSFHFITSFLFDVYIILFLLLRTQWVFLFFPTFILASLRQQQQQ